jgi:hypothetical protein
MKYGIDLRAPRSGTIFLMYIHNVVARHLGGPLTRQMQRPLRTAQERSVGIYKRRDPAEIAEAGAPPVPSSVCSAICDATPRRPRAAKSVTA